MAFINKIDGISQNVNNINSKNKTDANFEDLLKKEIDTTDNIMQKATKAEIQMKMVLEVRNKAINAYKELLKTQI
jgi:flagellar hook-basal body complex protein FliE